MSDMYICFYCQYWWTSSFFHTHLCLLSWILWRIVLGGSEVSWFEAGSRIPQNKLISDCEQDGIEKSRITSTLTSRIEYDLQMRFCICPPSQHSCERGILDYSCPSAWFTIYSHITIPPLIGSFYGTFLSDGGHLSIPQTQFSFIALV